MNTDKTLEVERGNVLTIRDLLNFLKEESEKDADILDYQIGRYDYDDFAVGFTGFTFGCRRISIFDLPVEEDMEGVDSSLVTKKILTID